MQQEEFSSESLSSSDEDDYGSSSLGSSSNSCKSCDMKDCPNAQSSSFESDESLESNSEFSSEYDSESEDETPKESKPEVVQKQRQSVPPSESEYESEEEQESDDGKGEKIQTTTKSQFALPIEVGKVRQPPKSIKLEKVDSLGVRKINSEGKQDQQNKVQNVQKKQQAQKDITPKKKEKRVSISKESKQPQSPPQKGNISENIRYKYQKLHKEHEKEIQINKFKYKFDLNNNHLMQFIGISGSGSTNDENKKKFQELMKQDKIQCIRMEQKEYLLQKLGIERGSKKQTKKFIEQQRIRNQNGEKISRANVEDYAKHIQAHGVYMYLKQLKHLMVIILISTILIIPVILGGRSSLNENMISFFFVVMLLTSFKSNDSYYKTIEQSECIQNYSVHVIFPRVDQIKDISYTQTDGVISYKSDSKQAKIMFEQMTMRDVHKHFSENFGKVHRMYMSNDFKEIYDDMKEYTQICKNEMQSQIETEQRYQTERKENQTIEEFERDQMGQIRQECIEKEINLSKKYVDIPFSQHRINGVFIVFDEQLSKENCLKTYEKYRKGMFEYKENDRTNIQKYVPVEVRKVSMPELILWENLQFATQKQGGYGRCVITNLVMMVLTAAYVAGIHYGNKEYFEECISVPYLEINRCIYNILILAFWTLIYVIVIQKIITNFSGKLKQEDFKFYDITLFEKFVFTQVMLTYFIQQTIILPLALYFMKIQNYYYGVIGFSAAIQIFTHIRCCKKKNNYNTDIPFKSQLQIDIDTKNRKPWYKLPVRVAQSFSIILSCFVHSSTLPYLLPVGLIFTVSIYQIEVSLISLQKCHLSMNELQGVSYLFLNLGYILRVVITSLHLLEIPYQLFPYFFGVLIFSSGICNKRTMRSQVKYQQKASFQKSMSSVQEVRLFSEAREDLKDKCLVTYDILENKNYKKIMALYKHMFVERQQWQMLVLPIQTAPEKMDEINKKIQEIQNKKKEQKKEQPKVEKQKTQITQNTPPGDQTQNSKANLLITSMVLEDIQEEKHSSNPSPQFLNQQSKISDLAKPSSKSGNEIKPFAITPNASTKIPENKIVFVKSEEDSNSAYHEDTSKVDGMGSNFMSPMNQLQDPSMRNPFKAKGKIILPSLKQTAGRSSFMPAFQTPQVILPPIQKPENDPQTQELREFLKNY